MLNTSYTSKLLHPSDKEKKWFAGELSFFNITNYSALLASLRNYPFNFPNTSLIIPFSIVVVKGIFKHRTLYKLLYYNVMTDFCFKYSTVVYLRSIRNVISYDSTVYFLLNFYVIIYLLRLLVYLQGILYKVLTLYVQAIYTI